MKKYKSQGNNRKSFNQKLLHHNIDDCTPFFVPHHVVQLAQNQRISKHYHEILKRGNAVKTSRCVDGKVVQPLSRRTKQQQRTKNDAKNIHHFNQEEHVQNQILDKIRKREELASSGIFEEILKCRLHQLWP